VKWLRIALDAPVTEWLDVPRTRAVIRVLPNTMLSARRLLNAYETVRLVNREAVVGCVVECGVWSGGGIGLMALADRRDGTTGRTFHLFDSFEGLPQPSLQDEEVLEAFRQGHPDLEPDPSAGGAELVAIGACEGATADEVHDFLRRVLGVPDALVRMHVGWFQDTIPQAAATIGPIAVLRLDGDWYESTKVCLHGLFDLVSDGGYVIIDDYGTFTGCRAAVDEFLAERHLDVEMHDIDGAGVWFRKSGDVRAHG
jgi:hypothetical protein